MPMNSYEFLCWLLAAGCWLFAAGCWPQEADTALTASCKDPIAACAAASVSSGAQILVQEADTARGCLICHMNSYETERTKKGQRGGKESEGDRRTRAESENCTAASRCHVLACHVLAVRESYAHRKLDNGAKRGYLSTPSEQKKKMCNCNCRGV